MTVLWSILQSSTRPAIYTAHKEHGPDGFPVPAGFPALQVLKLGCRWLRALGGRQSMMPKSLPHLTRGVHGFSDNIMLNNKIWPRFKDEEETNE